MASDTNNLHFGQATDQGLVRENNQDALMAFVARGDSSEAHPLFGLFLVADGMGGHRHGEKAAALTERLVTGEVTRRVYIPLLHNENDNPTPITEVLTNAVEKANSEVFENLNGAGSTLTIAVVMGERIHLAHIGDTRAYLIKDDAIEQLTTDHSLKQRMIATEAVDPEESTVGENVLYRAIGAHQEVEVDTLNKRMPQGSYLVLCSDGLWGQVNDEEIKNTVLNNEPMLAAEKLIDLAKTTGAPDNVTVVVAHMPEGEEKTSSDSEA